MTDDSDDLEDVNENQAAAKIATIDFQKINLLAALRQSVMCKMLYDLAVEAGDATCIRFTRVMLMATLVILKQYPNSDKMYQEAISLPTFAEDKQRWRAVLDRLEQVSIDDPNLPKL